MMDYGGLITIGAGLIGGATSPDRPDIAPYKPQLLEDRSIDDYAPELESLVDSQSDIASSLLKGELPKGVVDQIKMFAGEAAQRGGFGASVTRAGNLSARDLGLTALDAMAQGQQYAGFVQSYARDKMNTDFAIETSNANMLYDQWASQAEASMRSYDDDMARHNQLWGSVASGGSQLFTAWGNDRQRTQDQNFALGQTEMILNALSNNGGSQNGDAKSNSPAGPYIENLPPIDVNNLVNNTTMDYGPFNPGLNTMSQLRTLGMWDSK